MGLFNSSILEVVIGVIFVYLLLSILCTSANEWAATLTRRRAKMLRQGIEQLLADQPLKDKGKLTEFLDAFEKHALISSLKHDNYHPPYLAPRTFVAVVTDILTAGAPLPVSSPPLPNDSVQALRFQQFEDGVRGLPDGPVKTSILALIQRSNRNVDAAHSAVEGWFNDAMDRVNGWYKRRTQIWTVIIAFCLTLVANANTITIVRKLDSDPMLRTAVIEEAKVRAQKPRPTISVEYRDEDDPTNPTITHNEGNELSTNEMDLLGQMLGWHENVFTDKNGTSLSRQIWYERLIGWLLTILAISLGAPFWFDILNKITNIRFAGKSPIETSKGPEKQDTKPLA